MSQVGFGRSDLGDERQRAAARALRRRIRRIEEAGRAELAGWVGDPRVVALVSIFRPDVRALVEPLGLRNQTDIIAAAGVMTGQAGAHLRGSEWRNPFHGSQHIAAPTKRAVRSTGARSAHLGG